MALSSVLSDALSVIAEPSFDDPILQCDNLHLQDLLFNDTEKALELANSKLHSFPFKDVHICWHRLYTDASIIKACVIIITKCGLISKARFETQHLVVSQLIQDIKNAATEPKLSADAPWLSDIVAILDNVLIMSGAPLRERLVESLLSTLQAATESTKFECDDTGSPDILLLRSAENSRLLSSLQMRSVNPIWNVRSRVYRHRRSIPSNTTFKTSAPHW
ncbi:hypothetical protein N7471_003718 [Penicillium samsonianum]|uniref:uncharacterized protein n=1 Tax=Penicillium samsonianum TaxID=1882272 RepID=UPI0025475705|nr:uncharacterized protein N7471_003718 [Penicillium samsonianum]KAJ6137232.1 hypothetical protein N7471_003718 [Penicillium samsonianum]